MTTTPEERRVPETGVVLLAVTGPAVQMRQSHILPLPPCCPVSGNPQAGSTITISYRPRGWCLEAYAIPRLLQQFVGGWKGTPRYPADRNQEGMVALVAQIAADALGVPVDVVADLSLDAGEMRLQVTAFPRACPR